MRDVIIILILITTTIIKDDIIPTRVSSLLHCVFCFKESVFLKYFIFKPKMKFGPERED